MIEPIPNEAACAGSCHVHKPDQKILGVLVTELSLAGADQRIEAATRRAFLGSAISMLLLAATIVAAHAYLLRRRMRPLFSAIGRLGKGTTPPGSLPARKTSSPRCRVAFNRMASDLEEGAPRAAELGPHAARPRGRTDARTAPDAGPGDPERAPRRARATRRRRRARAQQPLAGVLVMVRRSRKALARGSFTPEQQKDLASWLEMVEPGGRTLRQDRPGPARLLASPPREPRAGRRQRGRLADAAARGPQTRPGRGRSRREPRPEEPQVMGDTGQIQQALMAVLINAVEAMPQGGRWRFPRGRTATVASRSRSGTPESGSPPRICRRSSSRSSPPRPTARGRARTVRVYGIVARHGGRLRRQFHARPGDAGRDPTSRRASDVPAPSRRGDAAGRRRKPRRTDRIPEVKTMADRSPDRPSLLIVDDEEIVRESLAAGSRTRGTRSAPAPPHARG